jgi:glycosyltransferase involved in cell wall biosynthesis
MSPLISIIIPAYNAERTILETIKSVQKQTFSDFEIIVINDGSTDRTIELVQSVEDARMKIFSYQNRGVSVARNCGFSHTTGEFIAFLDADDLWTSDKLELQLAALKQHPEAGIAYSWTYNMNEKEQLLHPVEPLFNGNVYADLLLWNFISNGSNPLIRRQALEFVGEFCPLAAPAEDWDYWLRLSVSSLFVVVPKHQILYRHSSISSSSKIDVMKEKALEVLEKTYNSAPLELQHLKNQSFSNVYQYYAEVYLRDINNNSGDINRVIQNLWKAVRLHPINLLSQYTQRLVIKALLIKLVSPRITNRLLQFFRKISKALKPQIKQQETL